MPPISINALADLRGRSLEVLWYADARVYAGQGKPRSAVGVALRLGDGVGSRLVRYVPAAMMTFVRLGDVWLGGKRVGSVPLDQAVFNRLSVTDETTAIAPAGASSSIPGGAPSFDLAFDKFDAHRGHTKSWVVRVDIDESTSLVVPCMELFRFYFAASGSLAAQLLSGVNAADKLFVEWHLSAKTGIANITLGKDIHGFAAATVARIASGGPARRAVRDLVKSGVSAYSDRRPWYPRLGFPFVGLTDLTAEGVWLDHPEKRVFVVHRILQCTHPFPFRQLFYRLFDGTQGNTRSVGITQPAAASDAPKVPSNAPAPPDLTSSEARDAHKGTYEVPTGQTEFEAFPDLASKKLVKVTRPALRAAAARNSDEAPGETTEVAPVGSDGGELSGSGKTRTLTYKIAYELSRRTDKRIVVAITYTHRAADEIQERIEALGVDTTALWIGTIHSFCLEWIIKPYGIYVPELARGYTVLDRHDREKMLERLCAPYRGVTMWDCDYYFEGDECRLGCADTWKHDTIHQVLTAYFRELADTRRIDFELILWYSQMLIRNQPHVAALLSQVFSYILVDEYQDTKRIQYNLVGTILRAGAGSTKTFIVGDPNQAIYGSLGGYAISAADFRALTGIPIKEMALSLPPKTGSLAEWLNSGKENGSDEGNKGAVHAGVQARGGAAGQGRTERGGDSQDPGDLRADAAQLDQG